MISLDPFGKLVPNIRFMGGEILARISSLPEMSGLESSIQKIEDILTPKTHGCRMKTEQLLIRR